MRLMISQLQVKHSGHVPSSILSQPTVKWHVDLMKGVKPQTFSVGDTVMYRKKLVNSIAHNVTAKMLLRWSELLVIIIIVNECNMLLVKPGTRVNVRNAHVSQLKRYTK